MLVIVLLRPKYNVNMVPSLLVLYCAASIDTNIMKII